MMKKNRFSIDDTTKKECAYAIRTLINIVLTTNHCRTTCVLRHEGLACASRVEDHVYDIPLNE